MFWTLKPSPSSPVGVSLRVYTSMNRELQLSFRLTHPNVVDCHSRSLDWRVTRVDEVLLVNKNWMAVDPFFFRVGICCQSNIHNAMGPKPTWRAQDTWLDLLAAMQLVDCRWVCFTTAYDFKSRCVMWNGKNHGTSHVTGAGRLPRCSVADVVFAFSRTIVQLYRTMLIGTGCEFMNTVFFLTWRSIP